METCFCLVFLLSLGSMAFTLVEASSTKRLASTSCLEKYRNAIKSYRKLIPRMQQMVAMRSAANGRNQHQGAPNQGISSQEVANKAEHQTTSANQGSSSNDVPNQGASSNGVHNQGASYKELPNQGASYQAESGNQGVWMNLSRVVYKEDRELDRELMEGQACCIREGDCALWSAALPPLNAQYSSILLAVLQEGRAFSSDEVEYFKEKQSSKASESASI